MRRVTLAGRVVLSAQELGDGEPVLLLRAWGETHRAHEIGFARFYTQSL